MVDVRDEIWLFKEGCTCNNRKKETAGMERVRVGLEWQVSCCNCCL